MKLLEVEGPTETKAEGAVETRKDSMFRAIFWMCVSGTAAVTTSAIFKMTSQENGISLVDFFFMRNVILALVATLIIHFAKIDVYAFPAGRSRREWLLLLAQRSLYGHTAYYLFVNSLLYTPVSICFVIFNTNPFWIAILAYLINGEELQRYEILGTFLCFLGICALSLSSVAPKEVSGPENPD